MTTVTAIDEGAIRETDIAIIGMAGRFPGARTVDELWRLVRDGASGLTPLTDDELRTRGVPAATLHDPTYVKVAGCIADVECFDADFFGISPRDAALMDPQVRHFLECAWEALEQAGHMPETFPGAVGVYAGCGMNGYLLHNLLPNPELVAAVGMFLLRHTGNDKDVLATTVSYHLNLKGPSITVQTACSTSLVAVHLAVQALLNGECDLALAGGVTIQVPHGVGYHYREGEMASPDGRCRAFDAESNGTVFSSGVGVVALRRLREALADGDTVYAVIKGSAVNNDGAQKVSYLAPSVDGHAAAIAEALAVAGVPAESVRLVLTHGMGTPIGDQIEVAALTEAFRGATRRAGFCRLGSVKPNIGHTDTAAGVAGLIVAAQALRHGVLPPLANLTQPQPGLNLTDSPFYLSAERSPWPSTGTPRRAGVSAIGIGGTNAHLILEEPPVPEPVSPAPPWQLLTLSAKTPAALAHATARLAEHLRTDPDVNLADVAYTLQLGRRALPYRRVAVCRDVADAVHKLESTTDGDTHTGTAPPTPPPVVLLCPDGPLLRCEAWQALSAAEPTYREAVERCLATLEERDREAVRQLLLPATQRPAPSPPSPAAHVVAAVVARYALAQLWRAWGVRPVAALGHGIGAHAAACIAGATPLDAALARLARWPVTDVSPPAGGVLVPDTPDLLYPVPTAPKERFTPDDALALLQDPTAVLLVLGEAMAPSLSAPHAPPPPGTVVVALPGDAPTADPRPALLWAAARLWLAGCPLRWEALHQGERRRRVPLPTYPFERQRHWIDPPASPSAMHGPAGPGEGGRFTITRLPAADGRATPIDDLERRVRDIWEEVLGVEGIGAHDDFFDLGGQSILAARLTQRIKREFGVEFGIAVLFEARTVAHLAALLREALTSASSHHRAATDSAHGEREYGWSVLVPIKPTGSRPPLFCVHGAFGHVLRFHALAAHLDPDQPFYGLQAQGLNGRQRPLSTIPEMARQYLEAIRRVQPHGPYFLGGYSGGGAVAFEMAQQLRATGEEVALLALIDAYCPPAIRSHELRWHVNRGLVSKVGRAVRNVTAGGPTLLLYGIGNGRQRRSRGAATVADDASLEPDAITDISPYFLMGWDRYDPEPLAVPLSLFRAATRIEVKRLPPDLGWGPYAAAGIETYPVPGDHFTVVYEPHARLLARALGKAIQRARARLAAAVTL
jgi:acyl transferase domain-containing protein/thioesterase domain-containing protein